MRRRLLPLLVFAAGALAPLTPPVAAPAAAEWWRNIGVGARVVTVLATDDDVKASTSWGGRGGMTPEEGWGPAFSLGWFDADIRENGEGSRTLGQIDVRSVMVGVGYTWVLGRFAVTASATAGVSFNGGSIDDALRQGGIDPSRLDVEIENSFAMRPEVEAEFFVVRKLALTGGVSYLFTRPDVTVRLEERTISGRWDASTFTLFGGVTVYPFR
jgi:hypothetical protein